MVPEVTEKPLDRDIVVSTFHPGLRIGVLISFQKSTEKTRRFSNRQVRVYFHGAGSLHDERSGSRTSQGGPECFQYDVTVGLLTRIVWMCVSMQDYRYLR